MHWPTESFAICVKRMTSKTNSRCATCRAEYVLTAPKSLECKSCVRDNEEDFTYTSNVLDNMALTKTRI